MSTLLIIALVLFIAPGLVVLIGDHLLSGIETRAISTRDLPNVAADLGTADPAKTHR